MPEQDSYRDLSFPLAGVDLSAPFWDQRPRQMKNGEWARSCRLGTNVRAYEVLTARARGGSRGGLVRYINQATVPNWFISDLNTVAYVASGANMGQPNAQGRTVVLVAVNQGNVFTAPAGATSWTQATNNTNSNPPLNATGVVRSTVLNQKLYFVDGTHYCYLDPSTNKVQNLVASQGTLPVDNQGNAARLCCTWRGRFVLSGILNDSENWFMSAVSDPTNWNDFPLNQSPAEAVAGNASFLGLIGEPVTALVPYRDDILILGCSSSLWQFQGDPAAGGQIGLITDSIGLAFGQAFCKDPYGTLYFVSNRCGIYTMVPGQLPQRISQQIEQPLQALNTGNMTFRMLWNDRDQGVEVFCTVTSGPAVTTHFFYDWRTGGWWEDKFDSNLLNPLACCLFDGNLPIDRAPLIGSWDGYVRTFSPTATTDDGTPITSTILLGPINTQDLDDILFKDIQAVLGVTSGPVTFSVFTGTTAEGALANGAVVTGTWSAARNLTNQVRRNGHALYVQIQSTNQWALEQIRVRIAATGKVRRRGA